MIIPETVNDVRKLISTEKRNTGTFVFTRIFSRFLEK